MADHDLVRLVAAAAVPAPPAPLARDKLAHLEGSFSLGAEQPLDAPPAYEPSWSPRERRGEGGLALGGGGAPAPGPPHPAERPAAGQSLRATCAENSRPELGIPFGEQRGRRRPPPPQWKAAVEQWDGYPVNGNVWAARGTVATRPTGLPFGEVQHTWLRPAGRRAAAASQWADPEAARQAYRQAAAANREAPKPKSAVDERPEAPWVRASRSCVMARRMLTDRGQRCAGAGGDPEGVASGGHSTIAAASAGHGDPHRGPPGSGVQRRLQKYGSDAARGFCSVAPAAVLHV